MHKLIIRLALLLFLLPAINVSQATTDLNVYRGKIDSLNLKAGKLVLDDSRYYLASRYTVKNKKGEVTSAFSLKTGQIVEYHINAEDKITEVIIIR